jgi:hypothetical protein
MLASVEEVKDLDRTREVLVGNVPNPFSAIADRNFLAGLAPARVQASIYRRFPNCSAVSMAPT